MGEGEGRGVGWGANVTVPWGRAGQGFRFAIGEISSVWHRKAGALAQVGGWVGRGRGG